jgi:hypothetical protein
MGGGSATYLARPLDLPSWTLSLDATMSQKCHVQTYAECRPLATIPAAYRA